MAPLYTIDENGNVVTSQGTIPAAFANAAQLNLGPSADLSIPAQPEQVPYQINPPLPAEDVGNLLQAPPIDALPAIETQLAHSAVAPTTYQADQPLPEFADQLPFDQRVERTAQQYSSLGGLKNGRAEEVERGSEFGTNAATLNADANKSDAKAEGTYYADAAVIDQGRADFAGAAARDLDQRQADVLKRSAEIREELDNTQLDPNRVFRKQGNFANIADVIGVAFGALAQFSTGRNVALELVRKKVEDDMTAQESRRGQIERQYNRLPDELQAMRSKYDNDVSADALERAAKYKVIEDKMREQLAAAKGTRAEAGLQAALFEVTNWRLEQLDRAEKSQLSWVALQAKAMQDAAKRAAGAGKGKVQTYSFDPKNVTPSSGEFRVQGPDGKPISVPLDISGFTEAQHLQFRDRLADTQQAMNLAATLEKMDLSTRLTGANKSAVAQQTAAMVNAVVRSFPGVATDKDVERAAAEVLGIKSASPDGIAAALLGGGADAMKANLRTYSRLSAGRVDSLLSTGVTAPNGSVVRPKWYGYAGVPDEVAISELAGVDPATTSTAHKEARASRLKGRIVEEDARVAGSKEGQNSTGRQAQLAAERARDYTASSQRVNLPSPDPGAYGERSRLKRHAGYAGEEHKLLAEIVKLKVQPYGETNLAKAGRLKKLKESKDALTELRAKAKKD